MGKRYKAKERDRLSETDRASGEPVKVVATRLGVSESTAYYWMKRARRVEPPRFARLVPTATMSKAVHPPQCGFRSGFLRQLVGALKGGLW
jgi:transposase-like protein